MEEGIHLFQKGNLSEFYLRYFLLYNSSISFKSHDNDLINNLQSLLFFSHDMQALCFFYCMYELHL